jgi:2-hydroxychromene-2-carboxylate isomerase
MRATWYFDFVSPFAYLQWQRIRGLSEHLTCELRPVLFAGLLDRHGTALELDRPVAGARLFPSRISGD